MIIWFRLRSALRFVGLCWRFKSDTWHNGLDLGSHEGGAPFEFDLIDFW